MNKHLLRNYFHIPPPRLNKYQSGVKWLRQPQASPASDDGSPGAVADPAILAARVTVISFTTGKVTFLNNVNIHSGQTHTVHTYNSSFRGKMLISIII